MENLQDLWSGLTNDNVQVNNFDNLVFGLNENAVITKFEYSTLTGVGGSAGNPALIVELNVGSNKLNRRWYLPTKVYFEGSEIQPTHPEYKKQLSKEITKIKAVITHWVKSVGYTDDQVKEGLSAANSFESLCKLATNMLVPHYNKTKVDLFLQYQYSIKGTADKTYLELPSSLGFGAFATLHQEAVGGSWTKRDFYEETDENGITKQLPGLSYVDGAGTQHRFVRAKSFMESNAAKQQTSSAPTSNLSNNTASTAPAVWE